MISVVHELRRASGTNDKLAILEEHEENVEWKNYLFMVYNPFFHYYTGVPADNTFISEPVDCTSMFSDATRLGRRELTGNAARDFAYKCSKTYGELFRLILAKSIKAGVSAITINKAYPGLIPVFNVMLAKEAVPVGYPMLCSTKFDGVRVIAKVYETYVELRTRNGKEIKIPSLEAELVGRPPGMYDGELVSGNGKQAGRTQITGEVNRLMKGSLKDLRDYTYCIFDYVTHDEWSAEYTAQPYSVRHKMFKYESTEHAKPAVQYSVNSADQVEEMFADRISRGYEGVILRYPEDPYLWKRSDRLIKRKAINEAVLTCLGIIEGTGKYEGMIGSLICEGLVKNQEVHVRVGTGLSDYDRDLGEACYIGREIEVDYNDIVRAKNREVYSLFLPRFKRIKGGI